MKQPVWIVEDVTTREDYTLLITFTNGTQRIYDTRPPLEKPIFTQKPPLLPTSKGGVRHSHLER